MRKKACFLVLVLAFTAVRASGQPEQMIADIRHDLQTDFGTYHPYLVQVEPSLPPLEVAEDFSNVVNLCHFQFTDDELALLRQNHFVVSPRRLEGGTGYREMYDIYNEARELGIPILVTTDAMLHTSHLVFDKVLKILEEKRFMAWLDGLLAALYDQTLEQQAAASDTLARWALWRNLEYLNVARTLLDSTFTPVSTLHLYESELDLIEQHVPFVLSPIFGYFEDYTQYIVRGHYTQSDSFRHYFKSMMWLGRMTFRRDDPGFTLAAILLTQALTRAQVGDRPAFEVWDDIYQPTVFFVGKSDDIGPLQYLRIAEQVYGDQFTTLSADVLADSAKLHEFSILAKVLPGPKIKYPGQPAGFRLMGQRFVPDSYVLDELVFAKIPDPRTMPRGLDVMAVLGSQRAYELLQQTPDWTAFPSYPVKLDSLRREFAAYPDSVWAQNVYWNWLYCLMPLLVPWGEGYPDWMQTPAWIDKDLYAALASWAELRHDTILYAKQSGTIGVKPEAVGKQGYVEPNPHLYARLASLARYMQDGLARRGLLFPAFERPLELLHNLLLELKAISEKELEDRPLAPEEYRTILWIGRTMEQIVEFSESTAGPAPRSEDEMPVIADVHTDAISKTVLEVAVGYPCCIYAICPIEGELVLARGGGFSYYEFTWPFSDRLTDEAWRQMLQSGPSPQPPEWAASFLAEGDWRNASPDFYYWKCGWAALLETRIENDTVTAGDPLQVEILYYGDPNAVTVWAEDARGVRVGADSIWQVERGRVRAIIPTTGLAPGRAWVEAQAPWPHGLGPDSLLTYRTTVFLRSPSRIRPAQGVELPRDFVLLPPYPNPFNARVTLAYELPVEAEVELVVYDPGGRRVRLLRRGLLPAGRYRMVWVGRDEAGRSLPSGVYLVRLQAGQNVAAQKVMLVR